ncbi:helix-turn-helix transcriptional regulator [Roseateles sp. UC29_93]|uniref:helix-turn-helix transcriptional regulator n=1 Tax=Roseateles sp. UC29_93 TaxID=3350177 RepID=UPI00366D10EF
MSRSARLLDLIQTLRRHRHPVTGEALATALDISLRTLYRDIATLQSQGARIDGAPGLGYVLREGFVLPPLMFSVDEVEALVLGSRWVAGRSDARLSIAARDALAKIAAVLPPAMRHELDNTSLLPGPSDPPDVDRDVLSLMRRAIRHEHKLRIHYRDLKGKDSERTVWPFALGYFDRVQVLVAWCELREEIRSFRTDRVTGPELIEERYPQRKAALLKAWREREGIAAADGN